MSNIQSNAEISSYQLGQSHVIESIWLKFYNNKQGNWIMKVKETLRLHETIKALQPKHILELGTGIGCSTEIMAFSSPQASIYTVESNPKCIEVAKALISSTLQERIYFKHCDVNIGRQYEVNPFQDVMVYTPYDWRDYDFIFIDGPGPMMVTTKHPVTKQSFKVLAELPGGDLINLLPKIKEGAIIYVDKRQIMCNLFIRHFSNYLDIVERNKDGVIYTVFKRNGKSLKADLSDFENSDLSYDSLQKGGYFE